MISFTALIASSSSSSSSSSSYPSVKPIACVPVSDIQPHLHYYHPTHETPVLIQHVLSPEECESISHSIVDGTSAMPVTVQRQHRQQQQQQHGRHKGRGRGGEI